MTQQPTRVYREDDGELVGLVAAGASVGEWEALSIFGGLLSTHPNAEDARNDLLSRGLSSLAEPWYVDLGNGWERCHLVEASLDRVVAVIAPYPFLAPPQVIPPGTPLRLRPPE